MYTATYEEPDQDFGPDLVRAIAQEMYILCYPRQSLYIPLEERKVGSQWFIKGMATAVLQSMGIDENRLDAVTVAEAIYNQRWASYQERSPFLTLPRFMREEYLDAADRMVKLVISGDYHA